MKESILNKLMMFLLWVCRIGQCLTFWSMRIHVVALFASIPIAGKSRDSSVTRRGAHNGIPEAVKRVAGFGFCFASMHELAMSQTAPCQDAGKNTPSPSAPALCTYIVLGIAVRQFRMNE
jgi:hypothetical protein